MGKLLDLAKIKIKLTGKTTFLAKVTLNWGDEFEVRFFRITKRPNGTLWFQPPALTGLAGARCFAVINTEEWHGLETRVIKKFFEVLRNEKPFVDEFIDKLEKESKTEEIDIRDIPI